METFTDKHGEPQRPDNWTIEQAKQIAEHIKTDQFVARFDPNRSHSHAFSISLINVSDLSVSPIYIFIRPTKQAGKWSFDTNLSFEPYKDHTGSLKSFYCSNYSNVNDSHGSYCIGISANKSPEVIARDIVRRLLPSISYFLPKYQGCLNYSQEIRQRLEELKKLLEHRGVRLQGKSAGGFFIDGISGGVMIRETGELAISHYYLNKPEQIADVLSLLLSFEE